MVAPASKLDQPPEPGDALSVLQRQHAALFAEFNDVKAICEDLRAQFTALRETVVREYSRKASEAIEGKFNALVAEWKATRGHHSRIDRLVLNRAYQAIIGLGQPAVPLLLEMAQRPSHWDWALKAITQADPVPKEAWGDLNQKAAAWVKWGRDHGFEY